MNTEEFRELVWQKGRELYRTMPWRENTNPYYVLVSELMLQQTQVDRVVPKFNEFIEAFPTLEKLAEATLSDVLKVWNGLGYNRRAKFLREAAKKAVEEFNGLLPDTIGKLVSLPGVGPNTAGSILVYGFDQPVVFVETNIRTVLFHHFFQDETDIDDKVLLKVVTQTLDKEHPREWYWALMDYGAFLKRQGVGRISQSKHYVKQTPLKGSVREVRGQIIRALIDKEYALEDLKRLLEVDERFKQALDDLQKEGLVKSDQGKLHLTK